MKRELVLSLFLLVLFSGFVSAALGITPARVQLDFVPGAEHEITYSILSDNPDISIGAEAGGGIFSEYITLSKKKFTGPGTFTLKIKFPDEIEPPGEHTISIGAKEFPSEDRFIGTSVEIRGIIKVFVPYPGRYAEAKLSIPDGNVGDLLPVEVYVINRGKERITADVRVDFFEKEGDIVNRMHFIPVDLESTNDRFFRKYLNTSGIKPGDYVAQAVVDYGEESIMIDKAFRVGSLFVRINNFTEELPQKGIERFFIDIESRWNGYLSEVSADVNISNDLGSVVFRTPSVDLGAWEKDTLVGFVDASGLEGKYKTDIVLNYAGEQSFASGFLVIRVLDLRMLIILVAGIVILIIIIILALWKLRNRKKKRK